MGPGSHMKTAVEQHRQTVRKQLRGGGLALTNRVVFTDECGECRRLLAWLVAQLRKHATEHSSLPFIRLVLLLLEFGKLSWKQGLFGVQLLHLLQILLE